MAQENLMCPSRLTDLDDVFKSFFRRRADAPEFMVGGCAHIAVLSSAHTDHTSDVQCAVESNS